MGRFLFVFWFYICDYTDSNDNTTSTIRILTHVIVFSLNSEYDRGNRYSLTTIKYTHGNKEGNTCNNMSTNFGLYMSFFVKNMKLSVLTTCQNLSYPKSLLCEKG